MYPCDHVDFFSNAKRLGVDRELLESSFFSISPKYQDSEWVLENALKNLERYIIEKGGSSIHLNSYSYGFRFRIQISSQFTKKESRRICQIKRVGGWTRTGTGESN